MILLAGAIVCLLARIYWLFAFPGVMTPAHRVVSFLFGNWLASLVAPVGIDGFDLSFRAESLFWLPWSAIVICFLVWGAIRAIKNRMTHNLSTAMFVIGFWMALGFVYDKVAWGMPYLDEDIPFLLTAILSDLASIVIFVGTAFIYIEQRKLIVAESGGGVVTENQGGGFPMTSSQILFSFEGRINRAKYWGYNIMLAIVMGIIAVLDVAITGQISAIYIIAAVLSIWPSFAIAIKRCHDRDRSGWFVLVALVPLLNLWYIVEIAFLRGTIGSNRFGPDPLETGAAPQAAAAE